MCAYFDLDVFLLALIYIFTFKQIYCPVRTFRPSEVQFESHKLHVAYIGLCTTLQHPTIF